MISLKRLNNRLRKYVAVGLFVYALEILVITLAQRLGSSSVVAVGISFWFGLAVSFILQKFITFEDKRIHHRIILPQIIAYSLLVLFNFGFTLLLTDLLTPTLPAVVTRSIALGITTIWNFYLYKTRIFKNSGNPVY